MMKSGARRVVAAWLLGAAVFLQACGGPTLVEPGVDEAPPQGAEALEAGATSKDIVDQLKAIPGLLLMGESTSPIPDTRIFHFYFQQPVDHREPDGQRFWMQATLLHRSVDAPMVLHSNGYLFREPPSQSEPTAMLRANELSLEHRYYGLSSPSAWDWGKLDIEQAAGDHHRIIEAFKPLYAGRWLSTGGGKGGQAAVFHRYFYPDDVDATVAYVTPSVHGLNDPRFARFLEQVGDEACRASLRDFQREALLRRGELLPLLKARAEASGVTFQRIGVERALEFGIVGLSFPFWQYGSASWCARIPAPGATASALFRFLDGLAQFEEAYGDEASFNYAPYYYQCATELGWSRLPTRHLRDLLHYPGEDVPSAYLYFPTEAPFQHGLMRQVERWVRRDGERMLFIYGENDPWSAGAFEVRERNDSFRFFVPGTNHSTASLARLPEAERSLALSRLFTWMGVTSPAAGFSVLTPEALGEVAPAVEGRPPL